MCANVRVWVGWSYVPFFYFHTPTHVKATFYACEYKEKPRNKPNCETNLKCALTARKPQIKLYIKKNS